MSIIMQTQSECASQITQRAKLFSIFPERAESSGVQFGVSYRVLDVAMSQVLLNGSRIVTIVGQFETGRVTQHVRMDREREVGTTARSSDEFPNGRCGQRTASFADEEIGRATVIASQSSQRSDLGTSQRVDRGLPLFATADVKLPEAPVDLVPPQGDSFRDPQAVPKAEQDERRIAVTMPAQLASGLHQACDFAFG